MWRYTFSANAFTFIHQLGIYIAVRCLFGSNPKCRPVNVLKQNPGHNYTFEFIHGHPPPPPRWQCRYAIKNASYGNYVHSKWLLDNTLGHLSSPDVLAKGNAVPQCSLQRWLAKSLYAMARAPNIFAYIYCASLLKLEPSLYIQHIHHRLILALTTTHSDRTSEIKPANHVVLLHASVCHRRCCFSENATDLPHHPIQGKHNYAASTEIKVATLEQKLLLSDAIIIILLFELTCPWAGLAGMQYGVSSSTKFGGAIFIFYWREARLGAFPGHKIFSQGRSLGCNQYHHTGHVVVLSNSDINLS